MSYTTPGFRRRKRIGFGGVSSSTPVIEIMAGVSMSTGTPICVVNGSMYAASNIGNSEVLGILVGAVTAGTLGQVVVSGRVSGVGVGLSGIYYLGVGVITNILPTVGKIIKVGYAINSNDILVAIQPSSLSIPEIRAVSTLRI